MDADGWTLTSMDALALIRLTTQEILAITDKADAHRLLLHYRSLLETRRQRLARLYDQARHFARRLATLTNGRDFSHWSMRLDDVGEEIPRIAELVAEAERRLRAAASRCD